MRRRSRRLTKAKELRTTDPLAAYYLGQSLVLVGQPEKAAAAFEEAIARKPAQADLLEIFQALGRVHQRAQRNERSARRLEPAGKAVSRTTPRVQEQIAVTLVEEGQTRRGPAAVRSAGQSDDRRLPPHGLSHGSGRAEGQAQPGQRRHRRPGAAAREAQPRELAVPRGPPQDRRGLPADRRSGRPGEVLHARGWDRTPRTSTRWPAWRACWPGRPACPEAQEWLDKALKLAPSRKELRLAFIEQLVDDQRYAEAIAAVRSPRQGRSEQSRIILRDWGKLILRDTSRPKEERQAEAEKIWRRLLAARPNDPLVAHAGRRPVPPRRACRTRRLSCIRRPSSLRPPTAAVPRVPGRVLSHSQAARRSAGHLAARSPRASSRTAANLARLAEVLRPVRLPERSRCRRSPRPASSIPRIFRCSSKRPICKSAASSMTLLWTSLAAGRTSWPRTTKSGKRCLQQQIKTYTLQDKLADRGARLWPKS